MTKVLVKIIDADMNCKTIKASHELLQAIFINNSFGNPIKLDSTDSTSYKLIHVNVH